MKLNKNIIKKNKGFIDLVIGIQWGDEGKGKIIDMLAPNYSAVARFNGGPNAGHTIIFDNKKFVLHVVPSGVHRPSCKNIVGNGVILDPISLRQEIEELEQSGIKVKDNLYISNRAHIILPTHCLLDKAGELSRGEAKIGSTQKGIGPTYKDKIARDGLRTIDILGNSFDKKYQTLKNSHINILTKIYGISIDELPEKEKEFFEAINFLKNYKICDTVKLVNDELSSGKNILAEGAQGTLLDIDHGTYPFVTSSNVVSGGVCTGLGVAPQYVRKIYGATKAYVTRVGSGPFPTELSDEKGEILRQNGKEFGATTGRPRRCGWLDLPLLKQTCAINGVTDLVILKSDVLDSFEKIEICIGYKVKDEKNTNPPAGEASWPPIDLNEAVPKYETMLGWNKSTSDCLKVEDLPEECLIYLNKISEFCNIPISFISVGPDRQQTIIV